MIPRRCCEDFAGQISSAEWTSGSLVIVSSADDVQLEHMSHYWLVPIIQVGGFNGQLEMYMKKFEDPKQSDPMSRMQNDLDETKIVLVREPLMQKGNLLWGLGPYRDIFGVLGPYL